VRKVLTAAAASCLIALAGAPSANARDGVIQSFDGTTIVYSFFPAHGLKAGVRAPTVMVGPGYSSGRADDSDANVAGLLDDGYNVLTWDPRGFGDSGGNVEIDSPDFEGRDASALIDLLVQQPEVALEKPGDPLLGMAGASYGGGIEWVTAAADARVDVIAPSISWQSLVTSLDKANTPKTGWGALLFALGVEGTTVPGATGGVTGQPGGTQLGRQQDPRANQALVNGVTTGRFTQADQDFFASRGPGDLVKRIRIPTLITQSSSDTLFTLNEAIENYKLVRPNGVPLKMVWFCGSLTEQDVAHGQCNSNPGPDRALVLHETLRWMDRWLKGDRSVDTGPRFEWVSQDGVLHAADDYPLPQGRPLEASGSGTLPLVPGSASGAAITAGPAANALNVPLPGVTAPTQLVGEPTLTLDYSGLAPDPDARVYAQIVDTKANQVVGPVVTPMPLNLDGAEHQLTLPLEAIALTATPDSAYSLQITDGTTVYAPQREAGTVTFKTIAVSLPTVSAAAASGNSAPAGCVDTRKFTFRIHQNRKRVVRVRAYVNGKLVKTVRGRRVQAVRLKRLPEGLFRVKIVAVTATKQRVTSVRTYRGCKKGKPSTTIDPGHRAAAPGGAADRR
jgi:ABC-2 type transport system ATP-binding protein